MAAFRKRTKVFSLTALLIFADVGLFAFALVTGHIPVFYGAACLASLLALIYLYLRIALRGIRLVRTHNESAVEGQGFFVEMAIANFSYLPVFCLKITDTFAPARMLTLAAEIRQTILPRSVFEFTGHVYISKKMGIYQIGPVQIAVSDPFGIFTVHRTIEHFTTLTVYPAVSIPERLSLMDTPVVTRVGEEIIAHAGYATDFRGQREYRKGDPKKTIHWRATARHRRLIVKEFDENGITDVAVFVDYRKISLRGTGNVTTLELGLNAAASVAAVAARNYHRFAMSFVGLRRANDVQFGTGMHHLHLVLHSMVSLGKPGKFKNYCKEAEEKLWAVRRNGTAVFVASQTSTDIEAMQLLIRGCMARGIKPIVALINDRSFIKVYPEQLEIEKEAESFLNTKLRFEMEGARVFTLSKKDVPADRMNAAADTPRWYRRDEVQETA